MIDPRGQTVRPTATDLAVGHCFLKGTKSGNVSTLEIEPDIKRRENTTARLSFDRIVAKQ